ncbi:hypothetical protein OA385_02930 [Paracoccaceae bacterium]|nr:hypothetical protein [Paracoccaceae bacterium]
MDKDKRSSKDELSSFFKAARSASPRVNPDLRARILRDAEKISGNLDLPRNLSWFNNTLYFLNGLGRVPSTVGFAASLTVGAFIGFYSPDWSEPLASILNINTFDEINFTGSFFEMNELFEDI